MAAEGHPCGTKYNRDLYVYMRTDVFGFAKTKQNLESIHTVQVLCAMCGMRVRAFAEY